MCWELTSRTARVVRSHLDHQRIGKLALHLRDVGDQEDLGEAGLLRPQGSEEVVPPLLVLAPEDLVKDQERALVHPVELGKVAGEGDPEGNRNIVLLPAAEAVDGVIVVDVPDEEVEVLVQQHLLVPPARDLADDPAHLAFEPAPHDLHEVDHVLGNEAPGESSGARSHLLSAAASFCREAIC